MCIVFSVLYSAILFMCMYALFYNVSATNLFPMQLIGMYVFFVFVNERRNHHGSRYLCTVHLVMCNENCNHATLHMKSGFSSHMLLLAFF